MTVLSMGKILLKAVLLKALAGGADEAIAIEGNEVRRIKQPG